MKNMKNMKIVSVAISTYNMEKYLSRCLDSLLINEILDDIEIIVINDGSTDQSLTIAESYKSKYPNTVILIDKPNGHYGSCINAALKIASGKYFRILDADDRFDSYAFIQYVAKLKDICVDMVCTNYSMEYPDGKSINSFSKKNTVNSEKEYDIQFLPKRMMAMHSLTYRTQLLKDIHFLMTEGIYYTDTEYVFYPIEHVKSFIYFDIILYKYSLGIDGQSVSTNSVLKNKEHLYMIACKMLDHLDITTKENSNHIIVNELQISPLRSILWNYYLAILVFSSSISDEDKNKIKNLDTRIKKLNHKLYIDLGELKCAKIIKFVHLWRSKNIYYCELRFVKFIKKLKTVFYQLNKKRQVNIISHSQVYPETKKNGAMNILILSDYFSWFYSTVVKNLQSRGIDIYLHCACIKQRNYSENDVNYIYLQGDGFNDKQNIDTLLQYIADKKIDIILAPHLSLKSVDKLLKAIRLNISQVKFVYLLHNTPRLIIQNKKLKLLEMTLKQANSLKIMLQVIFPKIYLNLLTKWIVKPMYVKILNLFDKVVVLSPIYIDEFAILAGKKGEKLKDKLAAIPNPRTEYISQFHPCAKKKEIVFVGWHREEKALHRLLMIWEKVQNLLPDWRLIIIGDGPEKDKWEKLAKMLHLQRTDFMGRLENPINFIDETSILCLVSNIEGLPVVFCEAMSVGTIPIGFNSFSAIYEIIDNWENGVIVQSFDLDEYAKALVKLALDENLRIRMAENAKNKVKQYDIDKVSDRWLDLFNSLLN
jgi:glycosyltransferase involved in cell wall biosynthesis